MRSGLEGAKGRHLARTFHLLNLLLEAPRDRPDLLPLLAQALSSAGWEGAMPGLAEDNDCLSSLARDIALIKALDILTFAPGRTYRASPGTHLPVWASPEEAQAIAVAQLALDQLGLPEGNLLATLLERVPAGIRRAGMRRAVTLAPAARVGDDALWERLHTGIARGRCLRLVYQKPNGLPPVTLTIDRAKIVWMTGAFYVVAFRPDYMTREPGLPAWKYLREYRLDRITAVEVLDMPVTLASLPAMRCVFLLGPELRERVLALRDAEGRAVQSVERLADGSIRVTLEEVSLIRARQRLLLFGEHLLAVEDPPELRQEIAKSVAGLAARFLAPEKVTP